MTDPLTRLRRHYPGAETFTFGDGPALSARQRTDFTALNRVFPGCFGVAWRRRRNVAHPQGL